MPHISIKAEPVATFFEFQLTNSLLTSLILLVIFFVTSFYFYLQTLKPFQERGWFFFFFYYINKALFNFLAPILQKKTIVLYPFLASLFFFILFQNWFGLLPGVNSIILREKVPLLRANTADLNTTLALGFIAVVMMQYYGVKYLGFKNYFKKFIDLTNPIKFFVGVLEILSDLSRVISFSFRLFGNIFAGEVLLIVIAFLLPVLASFPFFILEIFVGFIQALVFTLLAAVFISVAVSEAH